MNKEFFCGESLKKMPALYMISHMFIMPILDLYAASCDFISTEGYKGIPYVLWFISTSFFSGIVVEVGRKMRCPEDEENGVDTYSKVWGRKISVVVWLGSMLVALFATLIATNKINYLLPALIIEPIVLLICAYFAIGYAKAPTHKNSRRMEHLSGIWTFTNYFCLGIIPMILHFKMINF
jgi:4-hydroxybenzoate polyprenyltransferase